ncbi:hypothetical protein [Burkholderia ubonensis]|uniref:hypothetical protein n=1 Tax=Burkholderia ubonensis TaxID=101571 RepID=UPI00075DE9AB|nr:hypothetical protein [Burkholderia ubonensis]KVP17170.1 hypothetical protein WJ84_02505 [Burkholderia ubonensis]KVP39706.1 hypothetical protein WJ87_05850 [Burkholderia ubonensis]
MEAIQQVEPLALDQEVQHLEKSKMDNEASPAESAPAAAAAPRVDTPDWYELLVEAVHEPGQLSAAHRFFHKYSLTNCWLVATQLRALGLPLMPINTFNGWLNAKRPVQKGQSKSISLVVPVPVKVKDEEGEEKKSKAFTRFLLRRNWFHMGQTAGEEYKPEEVSRGDWRLEAALDFLEIKERAFEFSSVGDKRLGYAIGKEIAVSPLETNQVYGRLREMARVVLGHTADKPSKSVPEELALRDIEADTTAYLVAATLGFPGLEEARLRLQANLDAGAKLRIPDKCANRAFSAADKLINAGYC